MSDHTKSQEAFVCHLMSLIPNAPIYLQIIGEIKKRSVRGVYSPGSKLPSVRDMAREMGVNPNTMARAYAELEREGFVFTRRGQGSFVTENRRKIEAEKRKLAQSAVARLLQMLENWIFPMSKLPICCTR